MAATAEISRGASTETRDVRWPVIVAAGCTILTFGSAFVAIRAALTAYSPAQLAAGRFAIAALLFAAIAIFRPVRMPAGRDWPRLAFTGVLGFTVYALLINTGEMRVSAGAASFVVNVSPVFTAILASLTLDERMPARGWIGLAVSLAGTGVLAFGTGDRLAFEPAVLIVLAAAVVQAVYFTMQKPLITRYGSASVISWTLWSGTIFLLPFFPSAVRAARLAPMSATISVIYLAAVPTVIGYATWAFAVSHAPVGRITSVLYFVPPAATFIGWLALGERPTTPGVIGGCIVIAGVAMVNLRTRAARGPACPEEGARSK